MSSDDNVKVEEPQTGQVTTGKFGEEGEGGDHRWPSRTAFYLAAIGSAVGFGNVWRFPALAADYGGGAFFIPYVMALFIIGLPVLVLEISLGQYYQTGVVSCYGSIHQTMRGSGVAAGACAFMLVVYYSMLLGWVTNAFFDSFGSEDPWAKEGTTGEEAVDYFQNKIIGMSTLGDDLRPTRMVWANVGYAVIVWVCVYACLAFGMKWTGRIAYVTMGLPIILLFVFLGRAVSLDGSADGIKVYIGEWDMSVLTERPDVWSTAVSQIFFSLGVTFGVMPAYGSACPRGEPAFANAMVIGLSNCMFSFISGFAVFGALGHLAKLEGRDVSEIPYAGFSLVFGTWPVVFGTLPGGEHWVRLLFFNLFLLGIDSAFSILEAPISIAMDHVGLQGVAKWKILSAFTVLAYLLSLMYATDAGLIFLDAVDFYINFVFLILGLVETFAAGWLYGLEEQVATLGRWPVFVYMFANFGSVIVACGLWFGLKENAVWGGFLALFLIYFAGIALTGALLSKTMQAEPGRWTWKSIIYQISFANVFDLREQLSSVVGFLPLAWAFLIKQVIPHVLLILFINLAQSDNTDGDSQFGNYGGYVKWPYQVLGILCVAFAGFLMVTGAAMPKVYEGFDLTTRGNIMKITMGGAKFANGEEVAAKDLEYDEEAIPKEAVEEPADPVAEESGELTADA